VFGLLALRPGPPHEVARDMGAGVQVRNPYFEVIPLGLVAAVVTEIGVLQANEIAKSALWT
jgi:translation initiation factor 2B subunit (eIF-2B alpha/beta/delta family)